MLINTFGEFIKTKRNEIGIGSRKLCRLVGVAETYISQLERGKIIKPEYKYAFSFCKHLNIDETEIHSILKEYKIFPPFGADNNSIEQVEHVESSNKILYWHFNEYLETKSTNSKILNNLNAFAKTDITRASKVVNNLYKLINSDKESFRWFCSLLENDLTQLNQTSWNNILKSISYVDNEEYISKQ
jgi:transcriptional regulator with XRE-family HTH domain